ncbi:aminoglycoside N-acetyltransferase AAC(6)-Il (plasmid) [Providencia rettgeri]|nr:aminoglycoside N-acetyltransferase AAC(6)-Il [Providencia rettgeri]
MLGGFYQSYTYALTPRTWHNVPTLQERNVAGVALLRIRADRKLGKP